MLKHWQSHQEYLHFLHEAKIHHDLTKRSTFLCPLALYTLLLSTHNLTKRSTERVLAEYCKAHLSTHDLTKRSTEVRLYADGS